MKRRSLIALLAAIGALVACQGTGNTPRAAAERFLDEHYVHIDLEAAKQYSVGVARFKVEEEQRLVGDQQIDASTRRPRVSYRLAEQREDTGDGVTLVYDATLRFDDGDTTSLHWLVTTRREPDGTWKVSNYQEYE